MLTWIAKTITVILNELTEKWEWSDTLTSWTCGSAIQKKTCSACYFVKPGEFQWYKVLCRDKGLVQHGFCGDVSLLIDCLNQEGFVGGELALWVPITQQGQDPFPEEGQGCIRKGAWWKEKGPIRNHCYSPEIWGSQVVVIHNVEQCSNDIAKFSKWWS